MKYYKLSRFKFTLAALFIFIIIVAAITYSTEIAETETDDSEANNAITVTSEIDNNAVELIPNFKFKVFSEYNIDSSRLADEHNYHNNCVSSYSKKKTDISDFANRFNRRQKWFAYLIERESRGLNINPLEFIIIVYNESLFHDCVVSRAGAIGLSQVMPANAFGCGLTTNDLFDPEKNIFCGIRLYVEEKVYWTYELQNRNNGIPVENDEIIKYALAGYNTGRGNVDKALEKYKETNKYIERFNLLYSNSLNGNPTHMQKLLGFPPDAYEFNPYGE